MKKIKINIKNKAFFQVTRIRKHGKLNFGSLNFFCIFNSCYFKILCSDPKLHFYYVTVPKGAKKIERNSRKKRERAFCHPHNDHKKN